MQKIREEKKGIDLLDEIAYLKNALKEKEELFRLQAETNSKAIEHAAQNEKMLHSLVEAAAGKIGQDFFDNIVTKLAEWLGADCVLIGRMIEPERINALPLYLDGKISHNFSYALEDTPCSVTSRKGFCAYPENVINLFPKDEILVDLNAEGYIGTALYNEQGETNGVICAVSRQKLNIPPHAKDIMKIIGARVTAEIERKKIEEAFLKSEAELKESNAMKDKFFSILAHDLRSPLATAIGFSDLLLERYDTFGAKKNKEYIGIINQCTNSIFALLDNLLTWSRSQRGLIGFSPEKLNLCSFVNNSIELLKESANNKNISLQLNIQDNLFVKADKNMLATVLRNLISNAIKFTGTGGNVEISAYIQPLKSGKQVMVSIKDDGIGISEEDLVNLFQIDKNYSTVGTENEKGTGLGLVLCKEFVEKNGGNIYAESKEGKGSEFKFTLKTYEKSDGEK